jgi:hypothetical protein
VIRLSGAEIENAFALFITMMVIINDWVVSTEDFVLNTSKS